MIKLTSDLPKFLAALLATSVLSLVSTPAAPISLTKQQNNIENSLPTGGPYESAFFTSGVGGSPAYGPSSGFSGSVGAGVANSTLSSGSVSLVGNSTAAGSWIDGNGIPTGITLSFNVAFTVSTPSGNFLTLGATPGNGIGVAQSAGVVGAVNAGETLTFSALSLSSVLFSGTLSDPGYTFTPGTVSGAAINIFRSNNYNETTAGATLTDSLGSTWTFGTTAGGTVQSGLFMDNNYNNSPNPERLSPAPVGAFTITTQAGTWNLKGLGFKYDVAYDVAPVPEPGTAALFVLGGLISLVRLNRKKA